MARRYFPLSWEVSLPQNTASPACNYIAALLNKVERGPGRVRTLLWTEEHSTALYTARGRVDPYRHMALHGPGHEPATSRAPVHPQRAEASHQPHSGRKSSCSLLRPLWEWLRAKAFKALVQTTKSLPTTLGGNNLLKNMDLPPLQPKDPIKVNFWPVWLDWKRALC